MGTRTVRLDDDAGRTLARRRRVTGLSISEVLKRGLAAFEQRAGEAAATRPYDIYRRLDLGEGGWSRAPAAPAKQAVAAVIRGQRRR